MNEIKQFEVGKTYKDMLGQARQELIELRNSYKTNPCTYTRMLFENCKAKVKSLEFLANN